jgi:hypothetical protein
MLYNIFDILIAVYLFQTSNAARIAHKVVIFLFLPRYQIPPHAVEPCYPSAIPRFAGAD